MKNYSRNANQMHLRDLKKISSKDPLKIETYFRGAFDLANSYNTGESACGILDKNDLIQECYVALVEAWNNMDWDAIHEVVPQEQQAFIWAWLKPHIKLNSRHRIHETKDGVRIPRNKRWEISETKNVDDFLTQLFPTDWFAENDESLGLIQDEFLTRYDIEQLGIGLDVVMSQNLSNKEKLVLEHSFGVDRDKKSSKEIAKLLKITVSNVDKTKFVALKKLKNEEIKEKLKDFYDLG